MDYVQFKPALLEAYKRRDVPAIIRLFGKFRKSPEYPQLCRRLVKDRTITESTTRIDEIIKALLDECEQEIEASGELTIEASYFEIAEQLKRKFGETAAQFYLQTKMPDDFLESIRMDQAHSDRHKLTNDLIDQYKEELIRIEDGRRAIVEILQSSSHFPIANVNELNSLLSRLGRELRGNYKYLSVKPYLLEVLETADAETAEADEVGDGEQPDFLLFKRYLNSGIEPPLADQVRFQITVNRLFQTINKARLLSVHDFKEYSESVTRIWLYRADTEIAPRAIKTFGDLLLQVEQDQFAIHKRLAHTFVAEYLAAEEHMRIRHRLIETELAQTNEYLRQIAYKVQELDAETESKARVALEKVISLKEVFSLSHAQMQAAGEKPFLELERSALGISTLLSPTQLTEWIRIYSILFSNTEFLQFSSTQLDFSVMRRFISDLTTFHLVQNIAQLKVIIDRKLKVDEDEKINQFRRFNEALKIKVQSLMVSSRSKEKTLGEMIEELTFLQDESIQFLVAETFEGFQHIVDAFNATTSDYFVHDKEAMLKESRTLYDTICTQCLTGLMNKPIELQSKKHKERQDQSERPKASWFSRLFST